MAPKKGKTHNKATISIDDLKRLVPRKIERSNKAVDDIGSQLIRNYIPYRHRGRVDAAIRNMFERTESEEREDTPPAAASATMQNQRSPEATDYNFDMIRSSDSEGEESPHRPTPPSWSLEHNRYQLVVDQSSVNPEIIDNFFSMEPVNLRELFPDIEESRLRRNSSSIWNTPPQ